MQGGLVGNRTGEGGGSVALVSERETLKPVAPALIKLPAEANLVPAGFGIAAGW